MGTRYPAQLDAFHVEADDPDTGSGYPPRLNDLAGAVNEMQAKIGTDSSGVFTNSDPPALVFKQNSLERMRIHDDGALWWDNQGLFTPSFLTDSRINIKRTETAARSSLVYGTSVHGQIRQASTLGERMIGQQVYIEDSLATEKPVTGAVDNGSGLIRLTVTAHGYATGNTVVVWEVGGVTNANNLWTITAIDANTIDLQGSTFAGTYTSGGKMTNRAPFYAFQAIVVPKVARTGYAAPTLNYDDIACYGAYNSGTHRATDAFFVDANPAISGSAFGACFSTLADCDVAFYANGTVATAGLDFSSATFASGADGIRIGQGTIHMKERAAPLAPAANDVRIYAEDNGSGKTRIMALFSSGVAQVIATQP